MKIDRWQPIESRQYAEMECFLLSPILAGVAISENALGRPGIRTIMIMIMMIMI